MVRIHSHVTHYTGRTIISSSTRDFLTDFNILDFYVFGAVEWATKLRSNNTKNTLKIRIKDVMDNLNMVDLIMACSRFQARIDALCDVKCGLH